MITKLHVTDNRTLKLGTQNSDMRLNNSIYHVNECTIAYFIYIFQHLPEFIEPVCRNFWIRSWSHDKDVHNTEDIIAVCKDAGLGEHQINICLDAMKSEEIKNELKVGN